MQVGGRSRLMQSLGGKNFSLSCPRQYLYAEFFPLCGFLNVLFSLLNFFLLFPRFSEKGAACKEIKAGIANLVRGKKRKNLPARWDGRNQCTCLRTHELPSECKYNKTSPLLLISGARQISTCITIYAYKEKESRWIGL